jgi:hypothetical protein
MPAAASPSPGLFAERSQPLWKGAHATLGARLDRWEDSDGHMRDVLDRNRLPHPR